MNRTDHPETPERIRLPPVRLARPPDESCLDCGAPLPWVWFAPDRLFRGRPFPGTWLAPSDAHCADCRAQAEVEALDRRVTERLREMRVDVGLLDYRWERWLGQLVDRKRWPLEPKGVEPLAHFHRRILDFKAAQGGRPVVGITQRNWETARLMRHWRPGAYVDHDGRTVPAHWLFVHGPPGSGKSMLLTMLMRSLLAEPVRWVGVGDAPAGGGGYSLGDRTLPPRLRPLRRAGGWQVAFWAERDLQDAQNQFRNAREYGKVSPLRQAMDVQVLFLDDLGTAKKTASWRQDLAALIDCRYRRRLPTVVTGNLAYSRLKTDYENARMVSRFAAMVAGTEAVLDVEFDWRKLADQERDHAINQAKTE